VQPDAQHAEPAGLTEPLVVTGREYHDHASLLKRAVVQQGRVVEVKDRGKVVMRMMPA
jgi:hypothetical protein